MKRVVSTIYADTWSKGRAWKVKKALWKEKHFPRCRKLLRLDYKDKHSSSLQSTNESFTLEKKKANEVISTCKIWMHKLFFAFRNILPPKIRHNARVQLRVTAVSFHLMTLQTREKTLLLWAKPPCEQQIWRVFRAFINYSFINFRSGRTWRWRAFGTHECCEGCLWLLVSSAGTASETAWHIFPAGRSPACASEPTCLLTEKKVLYLLHHLAGSGLIERTMTAYI